MNNIARTNDEQVRAADPKISVWATANAGAGKTKVLIDRIARILLTGVKPHKILAVTYTKAAAAEMTTRLFKTLGKWTITDNAKLTKVLRDLDPLIAIDEKRLNDARALFASALETPGGLKVQTIHAFCGDLLKRFPIEAGIAPAFEVADEIKSGEIRDIALQIANRNNGDLFSEIARQTNSDQIKKLLTTVGTKLGRDFIFDEDNIKTKFSKKLGVRFDVPYQSAINAALEIFPRQLLEECMQILAQGGKTDNSTAQTISEILTFNGENALKAALSIVLTGSGSIRANAPVAKALLMKNPAIRALFGTDKDPWPSGFFGQFFEKAVMLETQLICENSMNLIHASSLWQSEYRNQKRQLGLLDFDDLLKITSQLLNRNDGSALWVMYKLDTGLSHILIDESQDTSAEQWDLLHPLLETLESQASDEIRTQFVVGDDKQSIYRFQGASPERYGEERIRFIAKNQIYNGKYQEVNFDLSFRTGETILDAVDNVWHVGLGYKIDNSQNTDNSENLETKYARPRSHFSARIDQAASCELWPVIMREKSTKEKLEAHDFPIDAEREDDAKSRLADLIARQIKLRINNKEAIWDKDKFGAPTLRPIQAGDFMILVKARNAIYHRIIKRLKQYGVKVAGADLIILQKEPAILDLLAIAQFALCPDDDFNLACVLKGAFCNLFDDDAHLLPICHNRGTKSVWQMLRQSEDAIYNNAKAILQIALEIGAARAPFDFFAHLLESRLIDGQTGWDLLLKRFGNEAREPIEIFLDLALSSQAIGAPNLTAFVDYIENKAQSVKREFNQNEDGVKVMTIHASKGREAPIVILPDTTRGLSIERDKLFFDADLKIPFWAPNNKLKPEFLTQLIEAEKQRQIQEDHRLLYVAMTRPRDKLILCGHQSGPSAYYKSSWYPHFENLSAVDDAFSEIDLGTINETEIKGKIWGETISANANEKLASDKNEVDIPHWVHTNPREFDPLPRRIAPSALIDENYEPPSISPVSGNIKSRFLRGTLIHSMLETLPQFEKSQQVSQAKLRLSREKNLTEEQKDEIISEALKIMNHTDFAPIFSEHSRAEVALIGKSPKLPDDLIINGIVDRLVISKNEILILDYKTNRPPPLTVNGIATQYINQMACYRALLQETYKNHDIKCALLWTDTPQLMIIPDAIMDEALSLLK